MARIGACARPSPASASHGLCGLDRVPRLAGSLLPLAMRKAHSLCQRDTVGLGWRLEQCQEHGVHYAALGNAQTVSDGLRGARDKTVAALPPHTNSDTDFIFCRNYGG